MAHAIITCYSSPLPRDCTLFQPTGRFRGKHVLAKSFGDTSLAKQPIKGKEERTGSWPDLAILGLDYPDMYLERSEGTARTLSG